MFRLPQHDQLILGSLDPFGWVKYRIGLADRAAHMHVIGTTGKGKSKLLEHCLVQDILQGRGVALLDPHGDLADDLLGNLLSRGYFCRPEEVERLVYIDPMRGDYSPGINLLQLREGEDSAEHVNDIIEVFKRGWELTNAPVFEDVMFNGLMALVANGLTIVELPRLLTDRPYRDGLLERVVDPMVHNFFSERFERWPAGERAIKTDSTLNKVSRIVGSEKLRNIFGQRQSTIDFVDILDKGKVLIVDLSRLSELSARLFGGFVTTLIQQAAMARRTSTPFFEYLDEFQLFVSNEGGSKTFSKILSEARKRCVYLVLAHQQLTQLDERIQGAIGNVGTTVAFGLDRGDAEFIAKRLFLPHGEEVKHEVEDKAMAERGHPLYYPLMEKWEQYVQALDKKVLAPRWAYVAAKQKTAVRLKTLAIPACVRGAEGAAELMIASMKTYAAPYEDVCLEINRRCRPQEGIVTVDWERIQDWECA